MSFALALLSSLLMALSQLTPLGWLALIGYVPLLWATHDQKPGRVFKLVFVATTTQYMATLYWLTITMNLFGHLPWILSVIALFLLGAIIACYIAGAFSLAKYLSLKLNWSYLWLFPIALCATEYLRDYGFIGSFPWGASGYSLLTMPVLLQGASIIGVYGLVFYVGLVNSAIFTLSAGWRGSGEVPRLFWITLLATIALITYGSWRLNTYDANQLKKVKIALLQGNIEQGIKNQAVLYGPEILERYTHLQNQAIAKGAEIVIWPESSYPYRLLVEAPRFVEIGTLAPVNIISAIAVDSHHEFYNSAYILKSDGKVLGRFDKSLLVPFGEYVPWPFGYVVEKLVPNLGSFARGKSFQPINANGISLAVTVCYEGVFPRISRAFVNQGAELLVNVTNDAWYGVSPGPYQHLGMYQMRSAEVGRSYARATNTGVSAWIDPRGRIHQPTSLYQEALVMAEVPISTETTLYQRFGDFMPIACLVILLTGLVIAQRPKTRSDWLWTLLGLGIILASHAYFEPAKQTLDESAYTKDTLFLVLGLLLGLRRF